jgi:hypothetical protein
VTWHAKLLLIQPEQVSNRLEQACHAGWISRAPTLWQMELAVLRMGHRLVFRPETIGTSSTHPVRQSWRAKLLVWRPLRFPFLLAEGAVSPWDMTGLASSTKRLLQHLLAAHHDGLQFVYDLEILSLEPTGLAQLRSQLQEIEGHKKRAEWLGDLCAYEHYHRDLSLGLARFEEDPESMLVSTTDPDLSLRALLRWCLDQPSSPAETWRAWRAGQYHLQHGLRT